MFQQPAGETAHPFLDVFDAHVFDVFQADFHSRDVQVIDRPILEGGVAFGQVVFIALHRGDSDRSARKPGAVELAEGFAAGHQRAETGRGAENFVKREGDKVRFPFRQVEPVGRGKRRGVEQNLPTFGMGFFDPGQGVLNR